MIIKKASFFTGMKKKEDYPGGDKPEVAFAGKSNVGKSSLINYIVNNGKLAYVSKQPGKTRLINFFTINDAFYVVDLPGYGFARVSKEEKQSWGELMNGYFETSKCLKALFLLMDIRHNPTEDDLQMVRWADHYGVPFLIIATKADKIAKTKRHQAMMGMAKYIADKTGIEKSFDITYASSLKKQGKDDILDYIEEKLHSEDGAQ